MQQNTSINKKMGEVYTPHTRVYTPLLLKSYGIRKIFLYTNSKTEHLHIVQNTFHSLRRSHFFFNLFEWFVDYIVPTV